MPVEYCLISIGTLSHNRLWGESAAVRTAHATTTLVVQDDRRILVDPSLPAQILEARYHERTGRRLADVTDVFCTTLRPVHRRALGALEHATWWCAEEELETYREHLKDLRESAERLSSDDQATVASDLKLLERFRPAPDKLGPQTHLYPLGGASPGSAGLLLTPATVTVLLAGDAAVTAEHLRRGQVWEGCFDTNAALGSLRDILEVADVIVPGHDNVTFAPRRWL
jgi:glyoxylase-like metal-dependent hydrolase (beta-lactamase superfamily II)